MSKRDRSPKREKSRTCTICLYRSLRLSGELPKVKDALPSTYCKQCDLKFCEDCLKECLSHDPMSIERRSGQEIRMYGCDNCQIEWCLSARAMRIGGGLRNAIESLFIPTTNLCWSDSNDGKPTCGIKNCKAIFCSDDCLEDHSSLCSRCNQVKHTGVCVVCMDIPLRVCRECGGDVACPECMEAKS